MEVHIKALILGAILLFFAGPILGQVGNYQQDVVYLKNGSIIRGEILEAELDGSIRIRIVGGTELVYTMDEVERITTERASKSGGILTQRSPLVKRENGVFSQWETGMWMGGNQGEVNVNGALRGGIGYAFNRWIRPGIAFGVDFFNGVQAPVIELLYEAEFTKTAICPFIRGFGGVLRSHNANFGEITNQKPGLSYGFIGGLRIYATPSFNLYTGLGFRHQRYRYDTFTWDWWGGGREVSQDFRVSRTLLVFGFMF